MQINIRLLPLPLLLLPLTGCGRPKIHLQVPQGVTGLVVVDCNSNDEVDTTVRIDAQGHGRASVCPRDGGKVFIDRNGSSVAVENIEWLKTGDGFTTQFRLNLN